MADDDLHRLDGTSEHCEDSNGKLIQREDNPRAFTLWTLLSGVGLMLVVLSFALNGWLYLPGAFLGLLGVSQSHRFRGYTHWYGLLVFLIVAGGGMMHLTNFISGLSSFMSGH